MKNGKRLKLLAKNVSNILNIWELSFERISMFLFSLLFLFCLFVCFCRSFLIVFFLSSFYLFAIHSDRNFCQQMQPQYLCSEYNKNAITRKMFCQSVTKVTRKKISTDCSFLRV